MNVLVINLILAVPIFLLARLTLKKINPTWNKLTNPFLWLITTFVTPAIYVGIFIIWFAFATHYPQRDFDKKQWTKNIEKRYEYADDLVDNRKLIGLSREEIKEMLGEPEFETESSSTYYIGFSPRHLFGIDPDYLEIDFTDGKVHATRVYNS